MAAFRFSPALRRRSLRLSVRHGSSPISFWRISVPNPGEVEDLPCFVVVEVLATERSSANFFTTATSSSNCSFDTGVGVGCVAASVLWDAALAFRFCFLAFRFFGVCVG